MSGAKEGLPGRREDGDIVESKAAQDTLVFLLVSLCHQPAVGCSFSFLNHHEYSTVLCVAEQLRQKWLDLTCLITWGTGSFQRGPACMSQEAEEQFDPVSFMSWRKALFAGFLSKRAQHDICNPRQLCKTCSSTAIVCLNIRDYNNPPIWRLQTGH